MVIMMKRLVSLLLAVFTVAALICIPAVADSSTAGTENPKLTADTEWYTKNPNADVFYISTAAEFLGMCELTWKDNANTTYFEGKRIELTADIDLNPGWEWSVTTADGKATLADAPVNTCRGMDRFHGTLDGCGHTVSGLYFYRALGSWTHCGFIYQVEKDCVIQNTVFTNGVIYVDTANAASSAGGLGMGALIGALNSSATCTIENVYFDLDVVHMRRSGKDYGMSMVAGLIGRINNAATPNISYYPVEIASVVVAGNILAINEKNELISSSVQTSQFIACAKDTSGLAYAHMNNCVAMGTIVSPCVEKYGEATKSVFMNYIEGALPEGTEITEDIFTTSVGKVNNIALRTQIDLNKADFVYSAKAKAIIPASVAKMLDPVFVSGKSYAQTKAGTAENTTDIRFVSAFQGKPADYTEVGYLISTKVLNPHETDSYKLASTTLYEAVQAGDKTEKAPDGSLWIALGINGIPQDQYGTPIYVRPYAVDKDGTTVYGKVMTISVNQISG